ncbi:hypothetical protein ACVW07_002988 [Cellulomonas sp. URHB0016]
MSSSTPCAPPATAAAAECGPMPPAAHTGTPSDASRTLCSSTNVLSGPPRAPHSTPRTTRPTAPPSTASRASSTLVTSATTWRPGTAVPGGAVTTASSTDDRPSAAAPASSTTRAPTGPAARRPSRSSASTSRGPPTSARATAPARAAAAARSAPSLPRGAPASTTFRASLIVASAGPKISVPGAVGDGHRRTPSVGVVRARGSGASARSSPLSDVLAVVRWCGHAVVVAAVPSLRCRRRRARCRRRRGRRRGGRRSRRARRAARQDRWPGARCRRSACW